jgi:hypothetical protein
MKLYSMVKAMPVSLSRIEREYILQNLADTLPSLSILVGNNLLSLPDKSYSIEKETVSCSGFPWAPPEKTAVRVHFRHKQRGVFFNTILYREGSGYYRFTLPSEIYKEELLPVSASQICKSKLTINKQVYESTASPLFNIESIQIDPEICLSGRDSMRKVAERSGLENDSLAAYRLFEYLSSFKQNMQPSFSQTGIGDLFFIDHRFVLLSVYNLTKPYPGNGTLIPFAVNYDKRLIVLDCELAGHIPVNAQRTVLSLNMQKAQKEDKRFLYEKLYHEKYQE